MAKCPLCKMDVGADVNPTLFEFRCPTCGHFKITETLASIMQAKKPSLLVRVSAHTRQANEMGQVIELDTGNWESFAEAHMGISVSRKLDKLLKIIAKRSKYPGHKAEISNTDFTLLDSEDVNELRFLINQLKESGYINAGGATEKGTVCLLTSKGWETVETQQTFGIPGRCFVAMSFDLSLIEAWEHGIYPALKTDCGLDPIRIDKVHHNEKICDKLIAEIRQCQFLVADFTLHRGGVYFEAGFALGLGKDVIWTCKKDDLQNTHFDTRQYNHIDWTTPEELRERLRDRVLATIPNTV